MSPAVTIRPLRPSGGAGPADPVLVDSASYRRRFGSYRPALSGKRERKDSPQDSLEPLALVLFLAFVAGFRGGALLSLGA